MGELWGVYYEDFEENWLRYNSTVPHLHVSGYIAILYMARGPMQQTYT